MTLPASIPLPRVALRCALLVAAAWPFVCVPRSAAQQVAFVSWRDGNAEVYLVAGDGSGLTNLTRSPAEDEQPQWSPDGTHILFKSNRDGNGEVYVMNADGSAPTNLTNNPGSDDSARWSPDGRKITFISDRGVGSDLYVMNADGTSPVRLTNSGHASNVHEWSPDGTRILYLAGLDGDLRVMNADGGFDRLIAPGPAWCPEWSPDGTKILQGGEEQPLRIFDVNTDTDPTVVYTPTIRLACGTWSPDGKQILFIDGAIYVMNADGSSIVKLHNGFEDTELRRVQWTLDGTRIVVDTGYDEVFPTYEIYIMRSDGGYWTNLSNLFDADDYYSDAFGDFSGGSAPLISNNGIVLANLAPSVGTISPLSIISIFGTGFIPGSYFYPTLDEQGRIATTLGGTCVEIGGERAPMLAVTLNQANVQAPATASFGPVTASVIRNCDTAEEVRSNLEVVMMEEATPAFFLYPPYATDGWIAARFNDGFAAVAPAGMFSDQQGPSRPAAPGDIISLFGTGWGKTTLDLAAGELAGEAASLLQAANPMVKFGGIPMAAEDVIYIGATPDAAGLYQLAIRVPATAAPGKNQVVLTLYGKSTPIGPVISVAAR